MFGSGALPAGDTGPAAASLDPCGKLQQQVDSQPWESSAASSGTRLHSAPSCSRVQTCGPEQDAEVQSPFLRCGRPLHFAPPHATGEEAPAATAATAPAAAPVPEDAAQQEIVAMIRQQQARELELCPGASPLPQHAPAGAVAPGASPDQFLTPHMRSIVVSWLVEVADEFGLRHETLHLAVALLDRFLAATQAVPRGVLQMLAVACVMVAAKQLEIVALSVEQLVSVAANSFGVEDLRRMERILLDVLDFSISTPTSFSMLHLLAMGLGPALAAPPVAHNALFLLELALLDDSLLSFKPCELAAAALIVSATQHAPPAATATAGAAVRLADAAPERLATAGAALLHLQRSALAAAAAAATCISDDDAAAAGDGSERLLLPVCTRYGVQQQQEAPRGSPLTDAALP